jgi:hypothetical protein
VGFLSSPSAGQPPGGREPFRYRLQWIDAGFYLRALTGKPFSGTVLGRLSDFPLTVPADLNALIRLRRPDS